MALREKWYRSITLQENWFKLCIRLSMKSGFNNQNRFCPWCKIMAAASLGFCWTTQVHLDIFTFLSVPTTDLSGEQICVTSLGFKCTANTMEKFIRLLLQAVESFRKVLDKSNQIMQKPFHFLKILSFPVKLSYYFTN